LFWLISAPTRDLLGNPLQSIFLFFQYWESFLLENSPSPRPCDPSGFLLGPRPVLPPWPSSCAGIENGYLLRIVNTRSTAEASWLNSSASAPSPFSFDQPSFPSPPAENFLSYGFRGFRPCSHSFHFFRSFGSRFRFCFFSFFFTPLLRTPPPSLNQKLSLALSWPKVSVPCSSAPAFGHTPLSPAIFFSF